MDALLLPKGGFYFSDLYIFLFTIFSFQPCIKNEASLFFVGMENCCVGCVNYLF